MYGLCIFAALSGTAFWDYFAALLLLGLGWNFLYVSGSALIARLAEPEERGRVQGWLICLFFLQRCLCLSRAGALHSIIGWSGLVCLSCSDGCDWICCADDITGRTQGLIIISKIETKISFLELAHKEQICRICDKKGRNRRVYDKFEYKYLVRRDLRRNRNNVNIIF